MTKLLFFAIRALVRDPPTNLIFYYQDILILQNVGFDLTYSGAFTLLISRNAITEPLFWDLSVDYKLLVSLVPSVVLLRSGGF